MVVSRPTETTLFEIMSNAAPSEWVVDAFVMMGPTKRMKLGTSEVGSSRKVGCLM